MLDWMGSPIFAVEPMLVLVQEHVDLVTGAAALERERQKSVPRLLEAREPDKCAWPDSGRCGGDQ